MRTATAIDQVMLAKLRPGANALVAIDAAALKKTPLAITQKWATRRFIDNPTNEFSIPPESKEIVLTARLVTAENFRVAWEVGVMTSETTIPMMTIAKAEAGYVDWFGGAQGVWSPADTYLISLDRTTLGVVYPADRQIAARWVESRSDLNPKALSPYLKKAADQVDGETQMVLALDLKGAGRTHSIREGIRNFGLLANDDEKIAQWVEVLKSLEGITVELKVTDKIEGTIRVDFGELVKPLSPYEKTLLLAALAEFGATLPDLEQWNYRTVDRAIIGYGELSLSGMRRIASLVELPSTKFDDLGTADYSAPDSAADVSASAVSEQSSADLMKEASLAYYRAVTTLVDDLRDTLSDTRDNHALWFERYARKIDALPILNVDEDLLAFGANLGVTFRDLAFAKRSAGIKGGVRKSQVYTNYYYSDGSTSSGRKSSAMRTQIDREEQSKASLKRFESWNQIENETAEMRKLMTQRYGVEF